MHNVYHTYQIIKKGKYNILTMADDVCLARPLSVLPFLYSRRSARKCNYILWRTRTPQEREQSKFGPFFTCPVQATDDVYIPCLLYCVTVRSSSVYRRRRRICQSRSHNIL